MKPSTDAIEKWPGTAEKPVSSGVGDIGTVMGQVSRSNANRRARPGSRRGRRRTGQFHQARLALRLHSQREELVTDLIEQFMSWARKCQAGLERSRVLRFWVATARQWDSNSEARRGRQSEERSEVLPGAFLGICMEPQYSTISQVPTMSFTMVPATYLASRQ